jgi:hypothetical protein
MGRASREKGGRTERAIVNLHKELGIHAERYPLSGASRFRGLGHDTDIYLFGPDQAPLVAEVKARQSGEGFAVIERWLGDFDLFFSNAITLRRSSSCLGASGSASLSG